MTALFAYTRRRRYNVYVCIYIYACLYTFPIHRNVRLCATPQRAQWCVDDAYGIHAHPLHRVHMYLTVFTYIVCTMVARRVQTILLSGELLVRKLSPIIGRRVLLLCATITLTRPRGDLCQHARNPRKNSPGAYTATKTTILENEKYKNSHHPCVRIIPSAVYATKVCGCLWARFFYIIIDRTN